MGRKKMKDSEVKGKVLKIRIDEHLYERLQQASKLSCQNMSKFARDAIAENIEIIEEMNRNGRFNF